MVKNNNTSIQIPKLSFFIKYLIISILLFHFLGIVGILFAFFYPFWWFFIPDRTLCIYCLHQYLLKKKQGYCPVCKRKTSTIYGPPLYSVLINTATLLTLSLIAFFIIYSEVKIAGQTNLNFAAFFIPKKANFILPQKYNFPVGKEFSFEIKVKSPESPVNVIQTDIQFDKDLIKVTSIDTEQSFATIFTQKDFSNTDGWIRIVGGIPNPGFIGEQGLFARINFKPIKVGAGRIDFLPSSRILANDGKGSNILAHFPSQSFIIEEEKRILGEKTRSTFWEKIANYLSFLFR